MRVSSATMLLTPTCAADQPCRQNQDSNVPFDHEEFLQKSSGCAP
jgi:hypothetical protein